ncbi:MAG: hypothetical protein LBD82_08720 [Deltaproteobacteria bacterium]|jgi:methyl-accepting chemotaxis protein|nr:hypothetical protein [Deltaproteobacteria bacterium]
MGLDLHGFATKGVQNVKDMSNDIGQEINNISENSQEMKQEDMLVFQYKIGQYNAYMTFLTHTINSLTSLAKEMAQSIK